MFIDMHMHESRFSKDSFLKLEEMVEIAKQRRPAYYWEGEYKIWDMEMPIHKPFLIKP